MQPYIGITGFTNREQVEKVLEIFPHNCSHKLMVGVLASHKSLRNIPMKPKWEQQTPPLKQVKEIFIDDPRVLNLVHYSADRIQEKSLLEDMWLIQNESGPNFHGFQLNFVWPNPDILMQYRLRRGYDPKIVLQIGSRVLGRAGRGYRDLALRLDDYVELIDSILIDPSGGRGVLFVPNKAREILLVIRKKYPELGTGVAGGLGPNTLDIIKTLFAEFRELSIDAQGRLRNVNNEIDIRFCQKYLSKALTMAGC